MSEPLPELFFCNGCRGIVPLTEEVQRPLARVVALETGDETEVYLYLCKSCAGRLKRGHALDPFNQGGNG